MTENSEMSDFVNTVNNSEAEMTSDNGLSKELIDLKKEMLSMETNAEVDEVHKNEVEQESTTDTNALLKQLDDALDELDESKDDPVPTLLEETKLLEDSSLEPENSDPKEPNKDLVQTNEQETEKDMIDASIEEIDDSDLKILDNTEDQGEQTMKPLLEEEIDTKSDDMKSADSGKILQEETQPNASEGRLEPKPTSNEPITAKGDEQMNDETIVLESDEEEENFKEKTDEEVNKSKRISIDGSFVGMEEPLGKRARSSSCEPINVDNSQNDLIKNVIENADEQIDKSDVVDDDLLVVAGGNRRRSETEIEINQIAKRKASPIQDDSCCDSLKRPKFSRDGSVDSTQDDIKIDSNKSEVQENGDKTEAEVSIEPSQDKVQAKTEPLISQNIVLSPKPEDSYETEEKNSPLSVEFLKKFKKSFYLMSRSDLEDFVLQKLVESIINKSEVSELRHKNEAQEHTIANQRQRINDLAKQFRDLEMVHNRVTKDLETKSTGLVTPVKITRAVGLQVSQPRPKTDFRPMYPQLNQRVPPFPSRSPQRPNNQMGNMNAIQNAQRVNVSLRQNMPQSNSAGGQAQFGQTKTSPIRPIGQVNTQAKMIVGMHKQQAMQRQQITMQQQRVQPQGLQRSNSGLSQGRSPITLSSPGAQQRSPNMLNQILSNPQSRGSPVVLRKIIRPGPASVQQAQQQALSQQQQQHKPGQNKFIDLTAEEDAARSSNHTNNVATTKIQVKSPATLNSSVIAPALTNGMNRGVHLLNAGISSKVPIQRLPGNHFVQISPKVSQTTSQAQLIRRQVVATVNQKRVHPAPLPIIVNKIQNASWKRPPPRPQIRINNIEAGIVISWTIHEPRLNEDFDPIVKYQIYAYQETNQPPATESWRHVGDVKAMALPMAVTLTQFQEGQRYHFAVRAVDEHERAGAFSVPRTWDEKT